ncbi:CPBP family intramembrane glutamic endopeptidase [Aeoliella mucimassa]|uniref:CAAX amino terminal protease self-immunity n=1 Tax=Aeoliella mucimassa TaxID=2527972 RepID=A0A518AV80_9BACT|nr:CPBP family intramembrane glutamic endopeptidase [Aeoliella mucimassa]QDU58620.1 CAAX amino terminal protease self- immunity [Aeoliella mucimassa]
MSTIQQPPTDPRRVLGLIVGFELGLGALGLAIAWLADIPIADVCWPADLDRAAVAGLLAALLLMPGLFFLLHSRWRPLVRLRQLVDRAIGPWLAGQSFGGLLLISLAAGAGEELLFRGALQPLAIRVTTPLVGILLVSLLFGIVHAASRTYFVLATVIGVYFGSLAYWQGEILSAAVAHALYDLVALKAMLRHRQPAAGEGIA